MKNLYNLIKNLSQSEKRYIKLRLQSTKAASQSILYFDTIARQKNYDFDQLANIDSKSVPVLRSNLDKLYRSILKQLRIFHADTNKEVKLQGVLTDVKLLKEKGLIKEAKKLNAKLVRYAKEEEQFHILKKALSNQWILLHLSGMLSFETTEKLEEDMEWAREREIEQEELNKLYRRGVGLYYSYFFKEKKSEYIDGIKEILAGKLVSSEETLGSDNSKMVYFEIRSICRMVLGDLKGHHEERKRQLKLLFSAVLFERDYINKLLVTSNLFTYLKINCKIKEFSHYLDFFGEYFSRVAKTSSDSVLIEKYFDVFFQNKIFQQYFLGSTEEIESLIKDFLSLVNERRLVNKLLISRTYLSLSELLIILEIPKRVIPLLIEYQDWDKTNKVSKSFIDSELLFLVIYWKREKFDSLELKITAFTKFVKAKDVKLDYDQATLLAVIKHNYLGDDKPKVDYKRLKKPANKIIIESILKGKSFAEQAKLHFQDQSDGYENECDNLLQLLNSKI